MAGGRAAFFGAGLQDSRVGRGHTRVEEASVVTCFAPGEPVTATAQCAAVLGWNHARAENWCDAVVANFL